MVAINESAQWQFPLTQNLVGVKDIEQIVILFFWYYPIVDSEIVFFF